MIYPVRCCCRCAVLGYLQTDRILVPGDTVQQGPVTLIAQMTTEGLALKSEDYPYEDLERVPGFFYYSPDENE